MGRTSEEGGLAWKGTPPPTPGKARCPRAWRNYGGERGEGGKGGGGGVRLPRRAGRRVRAEGSLR
jgi:hypothetical protein